MNFETLLRLIIDHHTKTILAAFQQQLQRGITNRVFSAPGVAELVGDGTRGFCNNEQSANSSVALRVRLCADEVVFVTIDARTGRLNMRDAGDLAATGRSQRFVSFTDKLNENPAMLFDALVRLRLLVGILLPGLVLYGNYRDRLLPIWQSKRQSIWDYKASEDVTSSKKVGSLPFFLNFVLILCRVTEAWPFDSRDFVHSIDELSKSLFSSRDNGRQIQICLNYHQSAH